MSQLLFRLSKFSSENNYVLIHKSIRLFSTGPYLTLGSIGDENLGEGGGYIGDILLSDPAKEEVLTVRDKVIPEELFNSKVIGASHGWGLFADRSNHNSLRISDLFNPLASKSNTKIIPLPPLTTMIHGQTKVVWNVAMSSSPPDQDNEEEDCVVAIKFLGRQLSLCRLGRDLAWTNKLIPFVCSENSNLMYSKFNELVFHNVPVFPQSGWEMLDSCFREDHWVESPSGQSFLVRWYITKYYLVPPLRSKEPILMVFREDQETKDGTRNMYYTEDIGDLCIFLSKNDPFCVVASSCPGLKLGSIYLMGRCFSVYDLTTGTARQFQPPKGAPESVPYVPYWLPPFTI